MSVSSSSGTSYSSGKGINWSRIFSSAGATDPRLRFSPLANHRDPPRLRTDGQSKTIQNWSQIGQVQARCYKHKLYSSLDELLMKICTKQALEVERMNSISVKIGENLINDDRGLGRSDDRLHFRALILCSEGDSFRVVKRFKSHLGRDSIEHYFNQMEVRTVAVRMAREFNDSFGKTDPGTLRLLSVKQLRFSTPVTTIEAGSRFYNMEEDLQGRWIKYSDNVGYVNTNEYAATLQAFAHWTYDRSGGVLIVTDLHGVYVTQNSANGRTDSFLLCDPAIHCTDIMRFTGTNKGEAGFKLFFQSHQCNDICRHLRRTSTNGYSIRHEQPTLRPPTAPQGTTGLTRAQRAYSEALRAAGLRTVPTDDV